MRLKWSMEDTHTSDASGLSTVALYLLGMRQDPGQCHFEMQLAGHGIKLKDVKAGFPLPGQYHFRFKMKWESGT